MWKTIVFSHDKTFGVFASLWSLFYQWFFTSVQHSFFCFPIIFFPSFTLPYRRSSHLSRANYVLTCLHAHSHTYDQRQTSDSPFPFSLLLLVKTPFSILIRYFQSLQERQGSESLLWLKCFFWLCKLFRFSHTTEFHKLKNIWKQ